MAYHRSGSRYQYDQNPRQRGFDYQYSEEEDGPSLLAWTLTFAALVFLVVALAWSFGVWT